MTKEQRTREDSGRHRGQAAIWEAFLYRSRRSYVLGAVYGGLFAFFFMIGRKLEKYGSIPFNDQRLWRNMLFLGMFTAILAPAGWALCEAFCGRRREYSGSERRGGKRRGRHAGTLWGRWDALPAWERRLFVWGFLCLSYLLVLLAVFPGFFVYDAQEELNMVLTRRFTTHHPLLHVLFMGGTVTAVHKLTGSWNAGIFVYSAVQMMLIAGAFVYVLETLRAVRCPRALRVISCLFLAFVPTVSMFVLCSCKDGLFGAALAVVTAMLLRFFRDPEWLMGSKRRRLLFILAASLMLLLRYNALYAYAVFLLFFLFWNRRGGRRVLLAAVCSLTPILAALGMNWGMAGLTRTVNTEHQEILTVPIQQLARTFVYDEKSFTEEERALMLALMPEKSWKNYRPKLSDPVKYYFNNRVYEERRGEYAMLWLRKGLQHPAGYLNAWFMTSYGFWYPEAVIDCYKGNGVFTFTYGDSSYFGFETEVPGIRKSLAPRLESLFRFFSLDVRAQKIPVLHWLLSPGFLFWLTLYLMFGCLDMRRYGAPQAFLPAGLVWLTVLLGPCSLPRYVVWLWFLLPLAAGAFFGEETEKGL
ncbi:DUF6020 family protein [Lachnoclostridium sp. Marseille-P6806]|uniref:DUF6020 family protein n=1 Tax=Lachnoclostridium sp. Marseille-P6806 TaxID=2364793 RepID=UPI001031597E|nr:DUF6020 family protein [Lachnoclostridium sp. Marseille-P6806]